MPDGKTVTIKIETVAGNTSGAKKVITDLEKEAIASQKRVEAASRATDRAILQSQTATINAEKANAKAQANEFIRNMKQMESEAKSSSTSIRSSIESAFSGAFGGGLVGGAIGGFAGNIVGNIATQFAQIPGILKTNLDEAIKIASERQNALKGLASVAAAKGVDSQAAQEMVKNLRLVKAGIVDIGEASTAAKNLLATNFTLDQTGKLLERFSDSAAFGKQAALNFGEAIRSATEGLKNGNSILLDNAGMTKNLSVILEENGKTKEDVSKITGDLSVREAAFNGIMKETSINVGDANKLMDSWTGTTAALTLAQDNLYASVGNIITRNPDLLAALRTTTGQVTSLTGAFATSESAGTQMVNNLTSAFAKWTVSLSGMVAKEVADLRELLNLLDRIGNSFGWVLTAPGQLMAKGMGFNFGPYTHYNDALKVNQDNTGKFSKAASDYDLKLQKDFSNNLLNQMPTSVRNLTIGRPGVFGNSNLNAPNTTIGAGNPLYFGGAPVPGAFSGGSSKEIVKVQEQIADLEKLKLTASGKELKTIEAQLAKRQKILGYLQQGIGLNAASAAASGGAGGGRKHTEVGDRMVKFFEDDLGLDVTSSGRAIGRTVAGTNKVSLHSVRPFQAVDIKVNDVKDFLKVGNEEIFNRVVRAIEAGYRFVEERDKKNSPHEHFESRKDDKLSTFDSIHSGRRYFTPLQLAYLQNADQKRISKRNVTSDELDKFYDDKVALKTEKTDLNNRDDLSLDSREKEIKQSETLANLYEQMADALFNLNAHTKEEIFLRDVKLGKYGDLTKAQIDEVANSYKIIDADEARIKANEKLADVMDKQADAAKQAAEEQQRLFEETSRAWEDLLTDLSHGDFKSIWRRLKDEMMQSFIQPASQALAQLFGGFGGMQPAHATGGGGLLGGLFGNGPGGTPMFNPNSGGGGFNIGSLFQGLFGGGNRASSSGISLGSNLPAAASGSKFDPSIFGGFGGSNEALGASAAGSAGGLHELGNVFGGGGSSASGGLSLSSLAQMVGPQAYAALAATALQKGLTTKNPGVGFAWLGGLGFFSALIRRSTDKTLKHLKEAAAAEWGVNIKDKNVLKQLQKIGDQYFGKGQADKNATGTVHTEEGMNVIKAYAESSGQSSLKLDRMNYGDTNWEGNQFKSKFGGFRAMGGHVQAGVSYIVGEHRPEVFTPGMSGNISPSIGSDPAIMERLTVVLGQLEETHHQFATRLESLSPAHVIRLGAADAKDAIASANNAASEYNPRGAENAQRSQGVYR